MRLDFDQGAPAVEVVYETAQSSARLGFQLLALGQDARRMRQRHALAPRIFMQQLQSRVAQAALRRIDDPLEGEIVGGRRNAAEIGESVANFRALIKARTADHAIRQTERDEALLELAHLEGGAHQDRDLLQRMAAPLQLLDLLADRARLLLAVPDAGDRRLFAERAVCEERLAEPTLVMGDEMRGCGED